MKGPRLYLAEESDKGTHYPRTYLLYGQKVSPRSSDVLKHKEKSRDVKLPERLPLLPIYFLQMIVSYFLKLTHVLAEKSKEAY